MRRPAGAVLNSWEFGGGGEQMQANYQDMRLLLNFISAGEAEPPAGGGAVGGGSDDESSDAGAVGGGSDDGSSDEESDY